DQPRQGPVRLRYAPPTGDPSSSSSSPTVSTACPDLFVLRVCAYSRVCPHQLVDSGTGPVGQWKGTTPSKLEYINISYNMSRIYKKDIFKFYDIFNHF